MKLPFINPRAWNDLIANFGAIQSFVGRESVDLHIHIGTGDGLYIAAPTDPTAGTPFTIKQRGMYRLDAAMDVHTSSSGRIDTFSYIDAKLVATRRFAFSAALPIYSARHASDAFELTAGVHHYLPRAAGVTGSLPTIVLTPDDYADIVIVPA